MRSVRRSRDQVLLFSFAGPARRGHYERVLPTVPAAKVSVWIATVNVKELMVEDHRARPGRRSMRTQLYVSVLAHRVDSREDSLSEIRGHILDEGELVAQYERAQA